MGARLVLKHLKTTVVLLAVAAAASTADIRSAPAQNAAAGLTGASRPDDVIMARQLLMDAIESEMTPIDLATGGRAIALSELKTHAYMINTLLTAFPHLFPPETKPIISPDGSPGATAATEAIWDDFDAFYSMTQDSAAVAFDASQAADLDRFKAHAVQLRAACDSCHAQYMHVVDPSTPK
jgi:cytochrome c556